MATLSSSTTALGISTVALGSSTAALGSSTAALGSGSTAVLLRRRPQLGPSGEQPRCELLLLLLALAPPASLGASVGAVAARGLGE